MAVAGQKIQPAIEVIIEEEGAKLQQRPARAGQAFRHGGIREEEAFRIESAIGALQAGNGQKRCRDRSKRGYDRYVALGILGRNLHTLGKLLLAQDEADCQAAKSKRKRA